MKIRSIFAGLFVALALAGPQVSDAARNFIPATQPDESLTANTAAFTTTPASMGCWFKTADSDGQIAIMSVSDQADANDQWLLAVGASDGSSGTGQRIIGKGRSGTWDDTNTAVSAGDITLSTWQHALVVYTSATSRIVYLDGTPGTENTVSVAPANVDGTAIGILDDSTKNWMWDGDLAHCAVWTIALTGTNATELANGDCPDTVGASAPVSYWPIAGDASPEPDEIGTIDMTLEGTPTQSTGPAGVCAGGAVKRRRSMR